MRVFRVVMCLFSLAAVFLLFVLSPVAGSAQAADPLDTWTARATGVSDDLNSIAFGNGIYVAVGSSGTILSSGTAATWVTRYSDPAVTLHGVTHGNGTYVAVGTMGTAVHSIDGISWEGSPITGGPTLRGVTYGNGIFVAVGSEGSIFSSADGTTWTACASGVATTYTLKAVAFGNGRFVAVGNRLNGTTAYDIIVSSPDGVAWTSQGGDLYAPTAVAFGSGAFAMCANGGGDLISNATIKTSTDGMTWMQAYLAPNGSTTAVAFGAGTFVAVTSDGVVTSADGVNWTPHGVPKPGTPMNGIAFDGRTFVMVGNAGTILQSGYLISPKITVSPVSLSYPVTQVGKSATLNISVGNSGNEALTVYSMAVSGTDRTQFAPAPGSCGTIQPGGSCIVPVYFSPTTSGDRTAALTITSSDPETATVSIPLSGTAVYDTTPPETTITSGPPAYARVLGSLYFSFTSNESGATFQCSEGASLPYIWEPCTSPISRRLFTPLVDGTYYFRVRAADAAGNMDPTPAAMQYVVDSVLPTGSVSVNDGAATTATRDVVLTISGNGTEPGVYCAAVYPIICGELHISFSNDGVAWTSWEPAAVSRPWQLSPGDGQKVVYARFADGAGNMRQGNSQPITLQTAQTIKVSASAQSDSFYRSLAEAIAALLAGKESSLVTIQGVFTEDLLFDRCETVTFGPAYDDGFLTVMGPVVVKGGITVGCTLLIANGLEIR